MSASFRTISFKFEAVRGEYLSRTQWATQRPAILSMLQKEIYGKPYVRRIYIYIIYIYIYIDAAEAKLVSVGLAQARPNNGKGRDFSSHISLQYVFVNQIAHTWSRLSLARALPRVNGKPRNCFLANTLNCPNP